MKNERQGEPVCNSMISPCLPISWSEFKTHSTDKPKTSNSVPDCTHVTNEHQKADAPISFGRRRGAKFLVDGMAYKSAY